MRDRPAFDFDDRTEPIVVFRAIGDDCPMDFVFDDRDAAVVRLVQNQLVGGPKRDIINIAPECSHQIGSPLYHARPAGNIVEDFVDDVVGDDVEEVLAINEIATRTSNQIKVRRSILVDSVFGHSTLSRRFTGCLDYQNGFLSALGGTASYAAIIVEGA